MELLIIGQNGWKKPVKLEKAITRVGSSPTSDVQLESVQVAPLQLQILYAPDAPSHCKVVNLAGEVALTVAGAPQTLAGYMNIELHDGDEILLPGFTLRMLMPIKMGVLRASQLIGASFAFPHAVLQPNLPAVGRLTLKNSGDKPACQFQVDIKGLPADCYQVDPLPLLFPGAEEEVRVQFFHRIIYPSAGLQQITFEVSSPLTYPGEQVILQQGLYVAPVFNQLLEVQDDMGKQVSLKLELPTRQPAVEPLPQMGASAKVDAKAPMPASFSAFPAVPTAKNSAGDKEPVKPKVVRSPSESYWDENAG